MNTKAKSVVVVEQYSMETLYARGVYHSNYHFADDEKGIIEITRKDSMRRLVDIQVIDLQSCMLLK